MTLYGTLSCRTGVCLEDQAAARQSRVDFEVPDACNDADTSARGHGDNCTWECEGEAVGGGGRG